MIRVIIVEDEQWVRKGIIEIIPWSELDLELAGEAKNGYEALTIIENGNIDLVITDMKMPSFDGIKLLKELQLKKENIKIVVISGYSDYEYMRQAINSEVSEYILKPVDKQELKQILGKVTQEIIKEKTKQDEKQRLEISLNTKVELLIEKRLNELIIGENFPDSGVNLCFKYFTLCAILYRDFCALEFVTQEQVERILYQITLRISNEIKSIMTDSLEFNVFKNNHRQNEILILFKTDLPETGRLQQACRRIIFDIHEYVKKELKLSGRIAVSSWNQGINGIVDSYSQVRKALKFQSFNMQDIIYFDLIKVINNTNVPEFIEEKQLAHIFEITGFCEIVQIIELRFNDVKNMDYCYLPSIRQAIINLMLTIEHVINKQGLELSINSLYNENYIELIEELMTIQEMQEWCICSINKLNQIITYKKQIKSGDVITEIKNFIDNNYSQNINLIELAKMHYMNHIYLSRLFKSQTGENFIDYLTRIRMKKAKEFIEKGNFKIKEVAEMVGYNNPYYFQTSYKKYFGCTPGENKPG